MGYSEKCVNSGLSLFQIFSFKKEINVDLLFLLQVLLFNAYFLRNSCVNVVF